MDAQISRRQMISGASGALASGIAPQSAKASVRKRSKAAPFRYCLNTSTLMGHKLPITEIVDIAGQAGYNAIEPWIRELDEHVKGGKSLRDLAKRIRDRGLTVESSIGFFDWIVDEDARRAKAVEEAKRNMELVANIGGTRLACPPAGATDRADIDLFKAAERYRALLEIGDKIGVVPEVEVWGFSKTLTRLSQAMFVALESGHPKACVLPDVFHLYKGGTPFSGIRLLSGAAVHCFHLNDYPAEPPRDTITDASRVYPGDGIAPLGQVFRDLEAIGYDGVLSLELFNRDYWKQDAQTVASTGIRKMRDAVKAALGK